MYLMFIKTLCSKHSREQKSASSKPILVFRLHCSTLSWVGFMAKLRNVQAVENACSMRQSSHSWNVCWWRNLCSAKMSRFVNEDDHLYQMKKRFLKLLWATARKEPFNFNGQTSKDDKNSLNTKHFWEFFWLYCVTFLSPKCFVQKINCKTQ